MTDNIPLKLAVSICSNRPMPPRPSIALAMIVHYLTMAGVPFGMICRLQSSLLPQARQECMDEAIADGCTFHLWLDDDMEPPADCVLRMLQDMHKHPEIDIIAANYARKQDTLQYTAEGLDNKMMQSIGKTGLEEATKAGMGLMLVRLERVKRIEGPHFEILWDKDFCRYQGEDRFFTRKLRDHGIRIFVDHGISNFTQHWGDIGYNFRMFEEKKYPMLELENKKEEE